MAEIWQRQGIIDWSQIILNSYRHLLGKDLIDRDVDIETQAQVLFHAPFAVFSHNTDADPLYNYANKTGLQLWEMNWQQLTETPSQTTTQQLLREEREHLLAQTKAQGFVTGFQGIRISRTGKKYQIDDITVWNLADSQGNYCGQAATFSRWTTL